MGKVSLNEASLEEYKPIIGEKKIHEIRALAEKVAAQRVCHVNSTSYGGGVAEILHRLVPLMNATGLKAEWKTIEGSQKFFTVTKSIHNGLQGMKVHFSEDMIKDYLLTNQSNADELDLDHDFVVIHDPQPAAVIRYCGQRTGKWIWRCHIDLSNPNTEAMNFISPFILEYDSLIFTMKQYVPQFMRQKNIAVIPPSIDPLSTKNSTLQESTTLSILDKFDVDPERPIITQVGRFDPWKDLTGTIDVYRLVKKRIPDVQLLLVAIMARDDPEGWTYYEKTARHAGNDYDIHLLTDLVGVRDVQVNAFQRASDVALQMSTREGFGLTVTEALWKGVPVIGRGVGGIPLQIVNGETGFLVETVPEAAEKCLYLLNHRVKAKQMGEKGREHVLRNFLITRHLENYLKLFRKLK